MTKTLAQKNDILCFNFQKIRRFLQKKGEQISMQVENLYTFWKSDCGFNLLLNARNLKRDQFAISNMLFPFLAFFLAFLSISGIL